jgi:hypothetical protein
MPPKSRATEGFRCGNTDATAGTWSAGKAGFRILAYYSDDNNTLYPFCIYTHVDYPKQPAAKDLRAWLNETLKSIAAGPPPMIEQMQIANCLICGSFLTDDELAAFGNRCAKHRTSVQE